jgi:hypothetical protein
VSGAGYGEGVSEEPIAQRTDESEPTLAYSEPRPMPYGSSPYAVTANPATVVDAEAPRRPLIELPDVWTALLGTIGVSLLGLAAGFLWVWLAPRAMGVADGEGKSGLLNPETKAFAGADVTFLLIGIGAGLICAVAAALVARHRGVGVSVAMAVGGTLGSLLAAWLGQTLSGGPEHRWAAHMTAGTHHYFIELGTRQFLMAWPVVALAVTFLVALLTPDQQVETEATEPAPTDSAP